MVSFFVILITSIIYAVIRAFHDSIILHGKWKNWAFVEAVYICMAFVMMTVVIFNLRWWFMIPLTMIFAFAFWLMFDCLQGYLRTGNILHLGNKGFDLRMRKTFLYNVPIFGWKETGAIRLIFFKLFWLGLLTPSYLTLYNHYGQAI